MQGRRRHYKDIPKSVTGLVDDPFRSLAGELRRVGGFAKDTTPFSEFHLGGFPAPAREAQIGRARFRPRARKGAAIGQEHGRRLSARLVRPVAGGMSRCRISVLIGPTQVQPMKIACSKDNRCYWRCRRHRRLLDAEAGGRSQRHADQLQKSDRDLSVAAFDRPRRLPRRADRRAGAQAGRRQPALYRLRACSTAAISIRTKS